MRKIGVCSGGIIIIILTLSLSGCGTVPKHFKEEVGNIGTRVSTLESRVEIVESKQMELEMAAQGAGAGAVRTNIGIKARPIAGRGEVKDIQLCLKNAGLYAGKIDGIKGKATRKAIREFQRANSLKADGIVGARTWEFLAKYKTEAK